MRRLKAVFLSIALTTASVASAAPAMADTSTTDPTQVSTLVRDIEAAINALPAGSSVATIETAVNKAMGQDAFSEAVDVAALKIVQTAYSANTNPSIAVALLASTTDASPQAGGLGGGAPIGSPVAGSGSGSGYVAP